MFKKLWNWLDGKKTAICGTVATAATVVYESGPEKYRLPALLVATIFGGGTVLSLRDAVRKGIEAKKS